MVLIVLTLVSSVIGYWAARKGTWMRPTVIFAFMAVISFVVYEIGQPVSMADGHIPLGAIGTMGIFAACVGFGVSVVCLLVRRHGGHNGNVS